MQIEPIYQSQQPNLAQNNANSANDKKSTQQRQANFLSMCTLENKLPPSLFAQVQATIDEQDDLPQRLAWDCQNRSCSFQQLKLISGHAQSEHLSFLLKNQEHLSKKICQFFDRKSAVKKLQNPVKQVLRESILCNFSKNPARLAYISNFKNRDRLEKQFRTKQFKSKADCVSHSLQNSVGPMFERMKTVFGHAIIQDGCGTPVYNCKFDQSGEFIITGADDGIIKVWSRQNMILQASLHGHLDVIIDIAISKCNRYMASGSKDGTVIIWDLQNCTIIKRITSDHNDQVNRVFFIMRKCTQKQALKNLAANGQSQEKPSAVGYQAMTQFGSLSSSGLQLSQQQQQQQQAQQLNHYDQFLLTCSDDGTINIYDVSSFLKTSNDEYYTRGPNDTDKMYTPHSKYLNSMRKQNVDNDCLQSLILKKQKVQIQINEQAQVEANDKITRRTRKRNLQQQSLSSGGITNQTTANSSSQSQNNTQETGEIFMVKLIPDGLRAGSRNKHIDAVSVNKQGLLAGGTNHGEIYLWKINFQAIRQRKAEGHYQWVNSFKLHKKANHYVEFNQSGDILMTGSADGSAALWDTSFVEKKSSIDLDEEANQGQSQMISLKHMDISDQTLITKIEELPDKSRKTESQIDHIDWSINGRYAFVALSVKDIEDQGKTPIVKIKVFDTQSKQMIHDLNKVCKLGRDIINYACVMKPHPTNENILLACFDGGITLIYDVKRLVILQEIVEYGIYSIDQYTMNNAVDVDFTGDGEFLAMSSIYGTLSLYSTQANLQHHYQCTRVQQFFPYDDQMHDHNPYERVQGQPQLSGFSLNPYEVQPNPPIIGKFKGQQTLDHDEFDRQQVFAREFAIEEENFYQDQLRQGIKEGYFRNSAARPEEDVPIIDQDQDPASQIISENMGLVVDADMHEESDVEVIQGPSLRRGTQRRRLARMDEQPEDIVDSDEEDEEFNEEENKSQSSENSQENEDENEEDFDGLASEYAGNRRIHGNVPPQQNFDQRRVMHSQEHPTQSSQATIRQRPMRQTRRQDLNSQSNNNRGQENRGRSSRRRLRQVVHSGETSMFEEREDDRSNFEFNQGGSRSRRRVVDEEPRRGRSRNNQFSSADEGMEDLQPSEESFIGRRGQGRSVNQRTSRNSRNRRSRQNYNEQSESPISMINSQNARTRRGRSNVRVVNNQQNASRRTRNRGAHYAELESSVAFEEPQRFSDEEISQIEIMEELEELGGQKGNKDVFKDQDEELERLITFPPSFTDPDFFREDNYSQRGYKSKKSSVILKGEYFPKGPSTNEQDSFELQVNHSQIQISPCHFCNRDIDQNTLIGPFVRKNQNYFFHQQCLEANQYVKYDKKLQKWQNISFAVKHLVESKQYTCYRCLLPGSTIQCQFCDRSFHGHLCNQQYMLAIDYSNEKFICLFCRNDQNYERFNQEEKQIQKFQIQKLPGLRKKVDKEHLLETKAFSQGNFYMPQIGDYVVYFYQGHEQFVQSNNCFFYSGMQEKMASTDLPWMKYSQLKNKPNGHVVCKVIKITNLFPGVRSQFLINEYGDCSSDITQSTQVVSHIILETQDVKGQKQFVVQLFPSECVSYLVPLELYNHKLALFQKAIDEEKLIGRRFKLLRSNRGPQNERLSQISQEIKIIKLSAIEPEICSESPFKNIVCTEVDSQFNMRGERNRRQLNHDNQSETKRVSFWELIYPEENSQNLGDLLPCAFNDLENQRVIDVFQLFISKKIELCQEFLDRVSEQIANDYKSYVPAEMWLNLIIERLQNKYYRSMEQLYSDLDCIHQCSVIYNGGEDDLTHKSKQMIDKVKKEIRLYQSQAPIERQKKIVISKPARTQSNPKSQQFQLNVLGTGGSLVKEHLKLTQCSDKQQQSDLIIIDFRASSVDEKVIFKSKADVLALDLQTKLNQSSSNVTIPTENVVKIRKTRRTAKIVVDQTPLSSKFVIKQPEVGQKRSKAVQDELYEEEDIQQSDAEEADYFGGSNEENSMNHNKIQIPIGQETSSRQTRGSYKRQKIE